MISNRLKQVILRELGLEDWDLHDATTAAEVPGWDSLRHAMIIAAVEDEYRIRFTIRETLQLSHVGQLQALVDGKTH